MGCQHFIMVTDHVHAFKPRRCHAIRQHPWGAERAPAALLLPQGLINMRECKAEDVDVDGSHKARAACKPLALGASVDLCMASPAAG